MKITHTVLSSRILVTLILMPISACHYKHINAQIQDDVDTVDYIIVGDANAAAEGFSYPLTHNGFNPLLRIRDKSDFIRLFPFMFDKGVRDELNRMKYNGGWNFSNYLGESFGDGAFWRIDDGSENKINIVNITGDEFSKHYQELYAKDAMNLAPEYRTGMAWVYAYFAAEDDSFYGRIDALGVDERKTRGRSADQWRIMIWHKEQRPSERPSEIYLCHGLCNGGSLSEGSIISDDEQVRFEATFIGQEDSPWGVLEYTRSKSHRGNRYIRLKIDTPWLEKYKAD